MLVNTMMYYVRSCMRQNLDFIITGENIPSTEASYSSMDGNKDC